MMLESDIFAEYFYFCPTIYQIMNLQSILAPIVDALQWSFKHLLEPMSHWFNWVCIVAGLFGIWLWLRMQKKFTAKAEREGTII